MERRATDRSSDSQRSGKSPENNHGGVQKDTTPSHDAEHPRRAPIPQLLQAPKVPIVQPADTIIVAHGQPLFKSNGSATPFHNNSNVPPTSSSSQPLGNVPAALDPAYRQVASPDSRSLAGSGASSLDSTPGISRLARGDRVGSPIISTEPCSIPLESGVCKSVVWQPGRTQCFAHIASLNFPKTGREQVINDIKARHALGIWCCTRCFTGEADGKNKYCPKCRLNQKQRYAREWRKKKAESSKTSSESSQSSTVEVGGPIISKKTCKGLKEMGGCNALVWQPGAKRCFDHLWGKPVGKPTIRAVKERHALGIWCCTRCMTKEVASKQLYCLECRRKFKEMRLRKRKRDSAGNGGGDGTPNSEDAEYDENGEDNENDESGENGEDEAKYPQQRSSPKMSFDFDSDTSGASQK